MVIGITGHRPDKFGNDYAGTSDKVARVKAILKKAFAQAKPSCVVVGMALGVDQWAAEIALDLGIKVVALIPCSGQDSKWPPESQKKYADLLKRIQESGGTVEYVSTQPYTSVCMHNRNQRIVDYSTHILAVWDRSWGGTGSCVRLAKKAGRPVTAVHPTTLKVEKI